MRESKVKHGLVGYNTIPGSARDICLNHPSSFYLLIFIPTRDITAEKKFTFSVTTQRFGVFCNEALSQLGKPIALIHGMRRGGPVCVRPRCSISACMV